MKLNEEQLKIVKDNESLVPFVVLKKFYRIDRLEQLELFSFGYEGLIRAACDYREELGIKFSTFATKAISNAILEHLIRNKRISSRQIYIDDLDDELEWNDENIERIIDVDYKNMLFRRVKKIINNLPKKNQDIFWSYIGGETQDSIAKRWGVTHQNISLMLKTMQKKITIDKLDNQYNEV